MSKQMIIDRVIAVIEMLGGLVGIIFSFSFIVRFSQQWHIAFPDGSVWLLLFLILIFLIFFIFYILSLCGGYLLWQQTRWGYRLSIFIQAVQIPTLITANFFYQFISGILFAVGMDFMGGRHGVGVKWFLGSRWSFSLSSDFTFSLYINLFSLVALVYLIWRNRQQT